MGDALACLPSGNAAQDLVRFRSGQWPLDLARVIGTMALRGALIGGGMYLAGARGKTLLKYTAASTVGVEAFVLAWAAYSVYSAPSGGSSAPQTGAGRIARLARENMLPAVQSAAGAAIVQAITTAVRGL